MELFVKDRKTDKVVETIKANIEAKEDARQIFENATLDDKTAIFAALDEFAVDSFIIELGAIPDNHDVKVKFSYYIELKRVFNNKSIETFRLHIPMVHKQRYTPNAKNNHKKSPEHNQFQNNL